MYCCYTTLGKLVNCMLITLALHKIKKYIQLIHTTDLHLSLNSAATVECSFSSTHMPEVSYTNSTVNNAL